MDTAFLSLLCFDFSKLPCYGKNNVDSVWRQTEAECDVCVCCWDAPQLWLLSLRVVRLSYIIFCLQHDFEMCSPGTWEQPLWQRLAFWCPHCEFCWWLVWRTLLQAHCTAGTAFRGLTTRLIVQTQPQQWRVSQATHSHQWLAVTPESSQTSNLFLKWFAAEAQEVKDVRDFYRSNDIKLNNSKVWDLNNLKDCTLKDTLLHFSTFLGEEKFLKSCVLTTACFFFPFSPRVCSHGMSTTTTEHIRVIRCIIWCLMTIW